MALLVHCDGPLCKETTTLETGLGWISVEGADIHVLHFCDMRCCAGFMATFVFEPVLPFD